MVSKKATRFSPMHQRAASSSHGIAMPQALLSSHLDSNSGPAPIGHGPQPAGLLLLLVRACVMNIEYTGLFEAPI